MKEVLEQELSRIITNKECRYRISQLIDNNRIAKIPGWMVSFGCPSKDIEEVMTCIKSNLYPNKEK